MAADKKAVEEIGHDPARDNQSLGAGASEKYEDAINREFYGSSISDSYRLKSELIGQCMEEIGMGSFQWVLFVVTGFGGMIDNFWSQGIGTIQPLVRLEFADVTRVTFSSIAYNAGLIFGASFWGISADYIGRKPAFNATILIGGIFALAMGGINNFIGFCVLWSFIGTAAGGNVPVDNMLFLEFVPGSSQYLLTALSTWWIVGQLVVSLIGWVFIANFGCPSNATPETCHKEDNMGWRYIMFTLGAITLAFCFLRMIFFRMPESPRYLISRHRDADAVQAVNYVARYNGKPEPLTLEMLQQIDRDLGIIVNPEEAAQHKPSWVQVARESFADFQSSNFKTLFATRKLAQHTSVLWLIWLMIGIAYPLYFNFLPTYLAQKFTDNSYTSLSLTYRNYCIQSAVGCVGPMLAALLIQTRLGRRYIMAIAAVATGIFLMAYTTARSSASSLAFSCVLGFVGNLEYSILFAFTPESFPAAHRGLASGFAAALLRFGGLCASLIGTYTNWSVVPIYVAGAMWMCAGLLTLALPFETHHHAAI